MAFETLKAGWMHRQKSITKKWKRQWFVLTSDGMLRYFDNEYASSAEDASRMKADCLRISTDNNVVGVSPPSGQTCSALLQIQFRNKTWNLCAESPDDMKAWHLALEDARVIDRPGVAAPPSTAHAPYPQQQVNVPAVHTTTVPNQVMYMNAGQPYVYNYPGTVSNQQVIHHPNGQTTVIVNQQPEYVHYPRYGYGLGPMFYW